MCAKRCAAKIFSGRSFSGGNVPQIWLTRRRSAPFDCLELFQEQKTNKNYNASRTQPKTKKKKREHVSIQMSPRAACGL